MKALIRKEYCKPDQIRIGEKEIPKPEDHEILVKVHNCSVNRTDSAILGGKPYIMRLFTGLFKPKNVIPGTDFAGKVESTGDKVTAFSINDRVFGFDDIGLESQAEYLCISVNGNVKKIPDNVDFKTAAASLEGAYYAYNIIKKINIEKGNRILINGATGAIGSALLQLVRTFDVEIFAVGNTQNLDLLRSLGADSVIDYLNEDFTKRDEKFDFILDAVGKSTLGKCKRLLNNGGTYISSEPGPLAQNIFYSLWPDFLVNKKVIFPVPSDIKGFLNFIFEELSEGRFIGIIDREYSLESISDAYKYVNRGEKTGNVLIQFS